MIKRKSSQLHCLFIALFKASSARVTITAKITGVHLKKERCVMKDVNLVMLVKTALHPVTTVSEKETAVMDVRRDVNQDTMDDSVKLYATETVSVI